MKIKRNVIVFTIFRLISNQTEYREEIGGNRREGGVMRREGGRWRGREREMEGGGDGREGKWWEVKYGRVDENWN